MNYLFNALPGRMITFDCYDGRLNVLLFSRYACIYFSEILQIFGKQSL